MNELKDTTANIATIAGPGSLVLGWSEGLTIILILTGIILNVVRIYEIRKARDKDHK